MTKLMILAAIGIICLVLTVIIVNRKISWWL